MTKVGRGIAPLPILCYNEVNEISLKENSMKSNIKYSIYNLISAALLLPVWLLCFIVLIADQDWFSVFYGILLCLDLLMLFDSIRNIQWFDIHNGIITIDSPFGTVKRVQLHRIKKVFRINAVIFGIKGLRIRRIHLVLCLTNSVNISEIQDVYNRKKIYHCSAYSRNGTYDSNRISKIL